MASAAAAAAMGLDIGGRARALKVHERVTPTSGMHQKGTTKRSITFLLKNRRARFTNVICPSSQRLTVQVMIRRQSQVKNVRHCFNFKIQKGKLRAKTYLELKWEAQVTWLHLSRLTTDK